jgi:lipopolysaccharide transport protein LptA
MKYKILVYLLLIFTMNISYGLESDNQKPLIIRAQSFEMDYINGYAVYNGEVTLNQGTRNLESDQLYIYFSKDSNKLKKTVPKDSELNNFEQAKITAIKAVSNNKLVNYSEQLQNKVSNLMYAKAKIIQLEPQNNLLTLEKNASIEQNGRRLTSELLHYNIKNEVAYTPKVKNKRTKFTLG